MQIPFVGRESEIQELKNELESVKNGTGVIYFITGPEGIGKTRLLVEIAKYAEKEGFVVLFGHCLDEKAVPYLPISNVIEKYAKRDVIETYTPLALLGAQPAEIVEETIDNAVREKTRVLETYLRRFNEISQKKPVLFILDDLHRPDSGTLSFIHYLSRSISDSRILTIVAYPDEALEAGENTPFTQTLHSIYVEGNSRTFTLSPLSVVEVSRLLGAILGISELPNKLLVEVYERTGGNALFVEELGCAILEQGLFDAAKRELKVDIGENA